MINKIWTYGTKEPVQRVGVIVLIIGIISSILWMIERGEALEIFFNSYYFPESSDSFIYHLYLFLIPFGLLMSWGYSILLRIKEWVVKGSIEQKQTRSKVHKTSNTPKKKLYFKTNLAAFQFAVPLYSVNFSLNIMNIGLIKDKSKLKDGSFHFLVQIADMNGTTLVSGFNDKYSNDIDVGSLVYWKMTELIEDATVVDIPAIGVVVATLHPEFDPNINQWKIRKNLTK